MLAAISVPGQSCGISYRGTKSIQRSVKVPFKINFSQDGSVYKDFKWTPQDGLVSCENADQDWVNGPRYKLKDGCDAETMIKADVFPKPPVGIGPSRLLRLLQVMISVFHS